MDKCNYNWKRGWKCSREWWHTGPCALRPKWWNVVDRYRWGKNG